MQQVYVAGTTQNFSITAQDQFITTTAITLTQGWYRIYMWSALNNLPAGAFIRNGMSPQQNAWPSGPVSYHGGRVETPDRTGYCPCLVDDDFYVPAGGQTWYHVLQVQNAQGTNVAVLPAPATGISAWRWR